MKLAELFALYKQYHLGSEPLKDVKGIALDHRRVEPGFVFVAVKGTKGDGHQYVKEAIEKGATALVVESAEKIPPSFKGAYVVQKDTRSAAGELASRFYHDPASKLFCIGVTGTNGKTSTTYLIESILNHFGMPTGVMGTINHHIGKKVWESELTTPDPITLQKRLSEFVALEGKAAAFEVSSHALAQGRVDPIPFDVAVYTNLTRDHLDFHETMENYFSCKEKLFSQLLGRRSDRVTYAIVNANDEWGKKLSVHPNAQLWTYGEAQADFQFQITAATFSGTRFKLKTPRGDKNVEVKLIGRHSIYNAVAAIAASMAVGVSLEKAVEGLADFSGVPGRLEPVHKEKGPYVFVDYAHTDDALEKVMSTLEQVRTQTKSHGKLICVFGCGGDRDKGKRPLMAQAAIKHADHVYITSDNPRTEDPMAIIQDILTGVAKDLMNRKVFVEVDRREAIRKAIALAGPKDVILIAGKGHENYQIIGERKFEFSDMEVAGEYLIGL